MAPDEWQAHKEATLTADPWRPLLDYVEDDREGDPGTIPEHVAANGDRVALQDGPWIYLSGVSGSSRGDVPFLDKVNLDTSEKVRLFQSKEGSFQTFVTFVGSARTQVVIGHETKDEPRALRRVTLDTRDTTVLTEAPRAHCDNRARRVADRRGGLCQRR